MTRAAAQTLDRARPHVGPYERWIFEVGTDFEHPGLDRTDAALSCVLEFPQPLDVTAFSRAARGAQSKFLIPVLWQNPQFRSRFLPAVFQDDAPESAALFERFKSSFQDVVQLVPEPDKAAENGRASYRTNLPVRPVTLNPAWADTPAPQPALAKPTDPGIVIVAIIDDGVPFAHRNFASPARKGTRIDYCWSQSATSGGAPMLFGREFSKATIDALYADHGGDEEAVYRAVGLAGGGDPDVHMPLDKQHSHAAHVLDALTGIGPGETVGDHDRIHIIAVDLPIMASADTSGFGKDMFVLAAMHYILERADRIARAHAPENAAVPLIINLSYGHSAGPHDGHGLVEAAFDEMIAARCARHPTALVMPSGNMFLQNIHAVVNQHHFDRADGDGAVDLEWFVPPGDRTSSYVEIWYPVGVHPDAVSVDLIAPAPGPLDVNRIAMPAAAPDGAATHTELRLTGVVVGQVSTEFYRGHRWRHVVALAPTEADRAPQAAPAGRWTFRMRAQAGAALPEFTQAQGQNIAGGLQFWIQRDEDFGAAGTGARQSYFIDPANEIRNDLGAISATDSTHNSALIRRFGTLSGMATGMFTTRVGGYVEQTGSAADYSCAGALRHAPAGARPRVQAVGPQVHISAASERSFAQPGLVAAGTRTGIHVALRGTSSAAPQVGRALSLAFLHSANDLPAQPYDYLAMLQGGVGTLVVDDDRIGHPEGQNRLGRFLARTPRRVDDRDMADRVEKLSGFRPRGTDI